MPIPLPTIATREAIPSKDFPHLWINNLVVSASGTMEEARLYIEFCPYDAETDERLPSAKQEVREGLLDTVMNVPSAMAAYVAIQACIPDVVAYASEKAAALQLLAFKPMEYVPFKHAPPVPMMPVVEVRETPVAVIEAPKETGKVPE